MGLIKSQIMARYIQNVAAGEEPLITPDAARLLRGLLKVTLQRAADGASVKKNQLQRYERRIRPLSVRDRRWLQSAFESAGAEFFMGQGKLHVKLSGKSVIAFGDVVDDLKNLPLGRECADMRFLRGLSQRDAYKKCGVPVPRISAIENNHPQKYYLADRVALKKLFEETPEDSEAAERLMDRRWGFTTQPF